MKFNKEKEQIKLRNFSKKVCKVNLEMDIWLSDIKDKYSESEELEDFAMQVSALIRCLDDFRDRTNTNFD